MAFSFDVTTDEGFREWLNSSLTTNAIDETDGQHAAQVPQRQYYDASLTVQHNVQAATSTQTALPQPQLATFRQLSQNEVPPMAPRLPHAYHDARPYDSAGLTRDNSSQSNPDQASGDLLSPEVQYRQPNATSSAPTGLTPDVLASLQAIRRQVDPQRDDTGKLLKINCAVCSKEFSINGKNDGELCTRCFKKENRAAKERNDRIIQAEQCQNAVRSAMAQQTAGSTETKKETTKSKKRHGSATILPMTAIKIDKSRQPMFHASAEAAKAYLDRPPEEDRQRVELADDDWQTVKAEQYDELCLRLQAALCDVPSLSSASWDPLTREYNDTLCPAHFAVVGNLMQAEGNLKMIQVSIMVTVSKAIEMHEFGLAKIGLKNKGIKSDMTLTCGKRIEEIIKAVRENIHLKKDLVYMDKIDDPVRNPQEAAKRKKGNEKTNAGKSDRNQMVQRMIEGTLTEEDIKAIGTGGKGPSRAKKRAREDDNAIEHIHEDQSAPKKIRTDQAVSNQTTSGEYFEGTNPAMAQAACGATEAATTRYSRNIAPKRTSQGPSAYVQYFEGSSTGNQAHLSSSQVDETAASYSGLPRGNGIHQAHLHTATFANASQAQTHSNGNGFNSSHLDFGGMNNALQNSTASATTIPSLGHTSRSTRQDSVVAHQFTPTAASSENMSPNEKYYSGTTAFTQLTGIHPEIVVEGNRASIEMTKPHILSQGEAAVPKDGGYRAASQVTGTDTGSTATSYQAENAPSTGSQVPLNDGDASSNAQPEADQTTPEAAVIEQDPAVGVDEQANGGDAPSIENSQDQFTGVFGEEGFNFGLDATQFGVDTELMEYLNETSNYEDFFDWEGGAA